MKSKHLLYYLIAVSGLAACSSNSSKFHIIGEISGMPAQTVVLEQLGANDIVSIVDSVKAADNGRFEISGTAPEAGLYRLHFAENRFILLSIDKGNIKLNADWSTLENYTVAGSQSSEHLRQFLKVFREKVRDFNTMNIVMDTLKSRGNDSLLALAQKNYQEMNQEFTQLIENYADTTPYEPNAVFAARILSPTSEGAFLSAFAQSLGKRFPSTIMSREFSEYFSKVNLANHSSSAAKPQYVETGAMAPEISLPAPDGAVVPLSSLRGKFVLLDFWASWCGPCRAENPNVVAAYQKYKNKNFTVYSVSLDHNKDKWEQAIKDDGLGWTHVSDLKGWSSVAAVTYSIKSIPSNVLIDPSGKIVAHNLRGEQLEEMLSQINMDSVAAQ
jgi:thiol-disulfide isomerase/thioredoxin